MAAGLIASARDKRLAEFLSSSGRRRWSYGLVDCTMPVSDWVFEETGIDPAGPYRGAYTTAEECHALIKREGGFMPLIGYRMDQYGFERTQAPRTGDVGIVNAPIAMSRDSNNPLPVTGPISAIHQDGLWVMRSLRGWRFEAAPIVTLVTAWRI